MTKPEGEGKGQFRVAVDPKLKPAFDKLSARMRGEIKSWLIRAAIDPTVTRVVFTEGQQFVDGNIIDQDGIYYT